MATYLIIFKLLDALVFFALTLRHSRVGPLGDARQTLLVKRSTLIHAHGLIVLLFVRLRAHALDTLKLIVRDLNGVFGSERLGLLLSVSFNFTS